MKRINIFLTTLFLLIQNLGFAQDAEMADSMRSNGKIYVVVTIILVIFVGLISYLIVIDRKLSKTEKRISEKN
jgi:hypothetical protein